VIDSKVYVGLDLGTSGLKGVAVDARGQVIGRGQQSYPTFRPERGASEQDPADWLRAVSAVIAQILAVVPAQRWAGIGLSAMIPTLVTVDRGGLPTGNAITWEDSRADEYGERLRERVGADGLYRRTGQWVDGRYLIPMWLRLRETEPERVKSTAKILGAKDYIFGHLTGQALSDPSTATGFGSLVLADWSWDSEVLAAAGDLPELPEVVASQTLLPLSLEIASKLGLPSGLPICVGAADSVLGALGMGLHNPGDVAYVAGTSTVVLGISKNPTYDELHRFLVTPMATPGLWGLEMDQLSTGGAIRWLAQLLGTANEEDALQLASTSNPESAPIFLPYVSPGEQGALWEPSLTGAIVGLNIGHGPGDLTLALVNGILVESARCLDALESLGFGRLPLRVAGGSAFNPWFRQQLANATGRKVLAPLDGDSDYSALGAALLTAGAVSGNPLDVPGAQLDVTSPDPAAEQYWTKLTDRHERALKLLRALTEGESNQ
jgi:xylulokinase